MSSCLSKVGSRAERYRLRFCPGGVVAAATNTTALASEVLDAELKSSTPFQDAYVQAVGLQMVVDFEFVNCLQCVLRIDDEFIRADD